MELDVQANNTATANRLSRKCFPDLLAHISVVHVYGVSFLVGNQGQQERNQNEEPKNEPN